VIFQPGRSQRPTPSNVCVSEIRPLAFKPLIGKLRVQGFSQSCEMIGFLSVQNLNRKVERDFHFDFILTPLVHVVGVANLAQTVFRVGEQNTQASISRGLAMTWAVAFASYSRFPGTLVGRTRFGRTPRTADSFLFVPEPHHLLLESQILEGMPFDTAKGAQR
jgi:hypothetical protein